MPAVVDADNEVIVVAVDTRRAIGFGVARSNRPTNPAPMIHPDAQRLSDAVRACSTRARRAIASLFVVMALDAVDASMKGWFAHMAQRLIDGGRGDGFTAALIEHRIELWLTFARIGALTVASVLFLQWLYLVVRTTSVLGAHAFSWTPRKAVWSFFVPFMNLVRPYDLMCDIARCADPSLIDEPARHMDPERPADYRASPESAVPASKPLPRMRIGLWWASYIAMSVVANVGTWWASPRDRLEEALVRYETAVVASVLSLVAAGLAVHMVRGISARLDERLRRIVWSTPRELKEQGIEVR